MLEQLFCQKGKYLLRKKFASKCNIMEYTLCMFCRIWRTRSWRQMYGLNKWVKNLCTYF